jgi:hypothetical protein
LTISNIYHNKKFIFNIFILLSFIFIFFSAILSSFLIGESYAMDLIDCNDQYQFRSFNGTCNNLQNPLFGSTGIELLRNSTIDYADNISEPSGYDRPNPRLISNILANQKDDVLNKYNASDFIWQWGQFLDHDIDLTGADPSYEYFNVIVPAGDPFFDPLETGVQVIPLTRSLYVGGDSSQNPRQQINEITAYVDASNVYGSDEQRANFLRDDNHPAKLKTSNGNLLPEVDGSFFAGDVRANEQIGLTAMHTLFVREHNRIAEEISHKHPDFSDEQVYQVTRKIVGAKIQVITYNEFLPKLLGPDSIPPYAGYDPSVNPGISNEFSTASYRYGHSQLSANLTLVDKSGINHVPLREAFFNNTLIKEKGIDPILHGLAVQRAQEIDNKLVDDVRNFLFGPPGSGGFDLASLNIQRGRDHGLPDYNTVRIAYGLDPVTSFAQITSNTTLTNKLESTYGNVNKIDLWVGGLAEDHEDDAMVGETIQTILIDQFTRLRDGDRFWYQNDQFFIDNKIHMKKVNDTSLADIIKHNTHLEGKIQKDVFLCQYPKGGGHNIVHSEYRGIC